MNKYIKTNINFNKIKNIILFLLLLVSFSTLCFVFAQSGTIDYDFGKDNSNNTSLKSSILIPSDQKNASFSFLLPVPTVDTKSGITNNPDSVKILSANINDLSPNINTTLKQFNGSYSSCPVNSCSVLITTSLQYLKNINVNSDNSQAYLSDIGFKSILSSKISNKSSSSDLVNINSNLITFELCYQGPTQKDGVTIPGKQIIGTSGLATEYVQPDILSKIGIYQCKSPITPLGGSPKQMYPTDASYAQQFSFSDNINPLDCPLGTNSPKVLTTDLFGNTIHGVNTALGCLPGDISGLFAVILRISIGISSAVLFILILFNALIIMNSSNNPEKIKNAVGNISRGVQALLIILFSVFILSFIGLQIIPIGSIGAAGFLRLFGG